MEERGAVNIGYMLELYLHLIGKDQLNYLTRYRLFFHQPPDHP
jgi:hypothetical protein